MAGYRRGLSSNETLQPSTLSGGINEFGDIKSELKNIIQYGRVIDSILNEEYPNILNYGGINAIGGIIFKPVNFETSGTTFAKPLFPNLISPPLKNELVIIFKFVSTEEDATSEDLKEEYYYLTSVNIWNNPNCNPLPTKQGTLSKKKTYNEVEAGSPNNITEQEIDNQSLNFNSSLNPSQNTFTEKSNISPLLPFAGDTIHQGNFGNSIRLGSTSYSLNRFNDSRNNWSEKGDNGDPITLIRNGQNSNIENGNFLPITEDINKDLSSLYLTSKQIIPIITSNSNYNSFTNQLPSSPSSYDKPQVIINSDRLVFNSKTNNILLSSEKSVFIGANSSFNVSTKEVIIDSRDIRLGSKNAEEPMILGNKFLDNLEVIMKEISTLCMAIGKIKEVTTVNTETGIPNKVMALNGQLSSIANNLSNMIEGGGVGFIDQIEDYKSNVNKII